MKKKILYNKLFTTSLVFIIFLSGFGLVSIAKTNEEFKFIIITPSYFSDELNPLVTHKNNYGIKTKIITLEDIYESIYFPVYGRDEPEKIKYFIKNAKESWNVEYVLLVGAKSLTPVRFTRIPVHHGNYSYYISDLYYADLYFSNNSFCSWDSNNDGIYADKNYSGYIDEVDLYPDVYLGRILVKTELELNIVVDKIINYENTAYGQDWFNNFIACGGDDPRSILIETILPFLLGRLGHIVFEGEYLGNKAAKILSNFTAKKIYASGLIRPFIKGLTRNNINRAINEGAGFIMFNGHGNVDKAIYTNFPFSKKIWLPKPTGYMTSDILDLNNGYKLPVGVFLGCLCADFNTSESPIAWEFISHENGGLIASYACTTGGQYVLSSLVTESLHGHIMLSVFRSFSEGDDIAGKLWDDSIRNYLNDEKALELGDAFSMLNWNNKLSNHNVVEEWVLLGDPTLKIGGYPQL
jgi:hypothetical protein